VLAQDPNAVLSCAEERAVAADAMTSQVVEGTDDDDSAGGPVSRRICSIEQAGDVVVPSPGNRWTRGRQPPHFDGTAVALLATIMLFMVVS
jgi:hypothetical protein